MNTPSSAREHLVRLALAAAILLAAAPAAGASPAAPFEPAGQPAAAVDLETAGQLRLVVNIPAYRLDAYLDDRVVESWPVTIGKPSEPTFAGRFTLATVIWNPWWHPPAHRRPKDKVTAPGPRNPMGRVKLPLHGMYYVHGTANDAEIGRATSRGCVRMRNEDVIALARLVHRYGSPEVPVEQLAKLEANARSTRHLKLTRPVPVEIVYQVAEVRDGELQLHPDVYREEHRPVEELAMAALERAGLASQVDPALLAEAAAGAKKAVRVPVESLLVGAPVDAEVAVSEAAATATVTVAGEAGGAAGDDR